MAEYQPVSGPEFVDALALGVDVECRIGNAVYPDHHYVGWHISGMVTGQILHVNGGASLG